MGIQKMILNKAKILRICAIVVSAFLSIMLMTFSIDVIFYLYAGSMDKVKTFSYVLFSLPLIACALILFNVYLVIKLIIEPEEEK